MCVGYISRVYMSPTLIATRFRRILENGTWQGFLGIRARFTQGGPSSYQLPETSYIYTAIYIYYPYDDIDSIWNWSFSLLVSISWIFDIPDFNSSFKVTLVLFWFLFFFLIHFSNFVSWIWPLHVEVGSRYQSAQRKRVDLWYNEKRHESFIFSLDLNFLSFPALSKFWGRNFYKVGRM